MEIKTLLILGTIIFTLSLLGAGFVFGYHYNSRIEIGDAQNYLGCWAAITETNRSITIKVDNRYIEKIINTTRHEICHEIYFREFINYTWNESKRNESEKFASTCIPEDYIIKYTGG